MKKTLVAAGVVIALGIIWTGGAWYTGKQLESRLGEMFSQAKAIAASQVSMLPYVIAGVIYWVFNFIVEIILTRVEKRLNYYHD